MAPPSRDYTSLKTAKDSLNNAAFRLKNSQS
jgi:hypothetical protein